MSKLAALIFDVDGTLANTERDGHRVAFERAFAEAGLSWRWDVETYGELLRVSGGKERLRAFATAQLVFPEQQHAIRSIVGGTSDTQIDELVRRLHARKTAHYVEAVGRGDILLRPGVERLINEARGAGIRLAIATTTTYENVVALIEATLGAQALDWFEVIGAGDVVQRKKPAPDIYQYVLRALDLSAGDCMAFEDSHIGLRAASEASIMTIVSSNDYTELEDFSGAALVLDGFGTPAAPFTCLAGDAHGHGCVDLALLRLLIQK